jgi:sugar lactone lactonase YvrE
VAVDSAGNVYVADQGNATIRKVTAAGVVTTLAGTAGMRGSADGTGAAARFNLPGDVAVDGAGNVYVADTFNLTIRKITAGGVVTTLAGSAGLPGSADGTGTAARFNLPTGVAVDSAGNVYVADNLNSAIRKVTPTGTTTTVAGAAGMGRIDLGANPRFAAPQGLAIVGDSIVVSDANAILLLRHDTP